MLLPRASLLAVALALTGAAGRAETLSLTLRAGQPAEAVLDSSVDDRNFADPRSYLHHGTSTRTFIRKLTLTNTGRVPLTGPLLVVNGQDWSSADALRQSLALPAAPGAWMPRLFTFWRDAHSHADSNCDEGKEPVALLNFWSYALCGDTTASLTKLATSYGVPARKIPLNGHIAAEYFYDDAWHIFDTDQDIFYLRLDNRTVASAADLRADPLLARRTQVLGRYEGIKPAAMAFNTALHEYVEPREEKPVKLKTPPAPLRRDTLFPGEQMIIHAHEPPEAAVGRANLEKWGDVRTAALRVVEWVIDPAARRNASGQVVVTTAYPILRATNHATGETITPPGGQAAFEITLQPRAATDRISVYCQRTRGSLPLPGKGRNTVLLAATDANGTAKLEVEWEKPAKVIVPTATATQGDGAPVFRIHTEPAADQLRWEISLHADFALVPPNLDVVIPATDTLRFDPLTTTFFNAGEKYFLRVKARHDGVWGDWSAPLTFQVDKPARPAPATATAVNGRLRLSWPAGDADAEYLIFGSNRLDFVPNVFAADEIVKLREIAIDESRPNNNLIAMVTRSQVDLPPEFRFYRVIARRAGVLSVPGDLIVTPPALTSKLPPPLVLQNRWQRVDGHDEHLATEMPLRTP